VGSVLAQHTLSTHTAYEKHVFGDFKVIGSDRATVPPHSIDPSTYDHSQHYTVFTLVSNLPEVTGWPMLSTFSADAVGGMVYALLLAERLMHHHIAFDAADDVLKLKKERSGVVALSELLKWSPDHKRLVEALGDVSAATTAGEEAGPVLTIRGLVTALRATGLHRGLEPVAQRFADELLPTAPMSDHSVVFNHIRVLHEYVLVADKKLAIGVLQSARDTLGRACPLEIWDPGPLSSRSGLILDLSVNVRETKHWSRCHAQCSTLT
jgi:hypothetical protein